MGPTYGEYWLTLSYKPEHQDLDAAAYENAFKSKDKRKIARILSLYKEEIRRHLAALNSSLRRHSKTKLGKKWNVKVIEKGSCFDGNARSIAMTLSFIPSLKEKECVKRLLERPDRLHVHVLVKGTPAATVKNWIEQYWEKRHGMVWAGRLSTNLDAERYEKYMRGQSIVSRSWYC
jgi:hypothetical protein